VRANAARARYGSDVRRQFKTPFVGRELEKPLLIAAGRRSRRGRTARQVQALIAARLDSLPPKRKTLLQDAAVVGKVFWIKSWLRPSLMAG
jgi:hypothetical protein